MLGGVLSLSRTTGTTAIITSSSSLLLPRRCIIAAFGGKGGTVKTGRVPYRRYYRPKPAKAATATTTTTTTTARTTLLLTTLCFPVSLVRSFYSMPSSVTERNVGSGTITVTPKNEQDQSALVVIAHGLGDTAEGFVDVAEHLVEQMPYVKFILPTAPTQPVTMNMGMSMPSWYDIVGLDERSNENCAGIDESRERLQGILETEHQETGLPYSRMVMAGFSQGGALSLYTGMQLPSADYRLAAVVLMSGYIPHASKFKVTPGLEDTPVLHCHGEQDPLVNFGLAAKTKQLVTERGGTNYQIKSYPIQHTVSMDEIADVCKFLKTVLPPDDSCRVRLKDPSEMSVKELKAAIRKAGLQNKAVGLMEKREFVELLQNFRDGKL